MAKNENDGVEATDDTAVEAPATPLVPDTTPEEDPEEVASKEAHVDASESENNEPDVSFAREV